MNRLMGILVMLLSGCMFNSSTVAEPNKNNKTSSQAQQGTVLTAELSSAVDNKVLASEITLTAGNTQVYQNVRLRLVSVEDSRCPMGTACIWAGQLVVTLEVLSDEEDKIEVKLIRKREPEVAHALGYQFLLIDVKPHPKKGKTIQLSDQIVQLKILKSQGT